MNRSETQSYKIKCKLLKDEVCTYLHIMSLQHIFLRQDSLVKLILIKTIYYR